MDQEFAKSLVMLKVEECKLLLMTRGTDKPVDIQAVDFNLTGKCAGMANLTRRTISLNMGYLTNGHFDDMIRQTVPHEVAHLYVHQNYGERGHGTIWRDIMMVLGCEPRRTHDYNLEGVVKTYQYSCSCGTVQLTKGQHQSQQSGKRSYICRKCRAKLVLNK